MLKGKYLLIQFMYLSCPDTCSTVSSRLTTLYSKLGSLVPDKLILISVSFDPHLDTPKVLSASWKHFGARAGWHVASFLPEDKEKIPQLLEQIGVWLYKRPDGLYNHSAYLFLVDPESSIIKVLKPEASTDSLIQSLKGVI
ncbi:MAG: SCO family protein, partial [Spirochaetota bacterium]|nr:SCO family protein [Spirochaetota bacterium]